MDLLLIDGSNVAKKAFASKSPTPQHLRLIFGFAKSLYYIRTQFPRNKIVICWDNMGSARRIEESEKAWKEGITKSPYKGSKLVERPQRNEQFKDLPEQMPMLLEFLNNISCLQYNVFGYEADDVIHTLTKKNSGKNIIVSADRDYWQLITEKTHCYIPLDKDNHIMDGHRFFEKFGFQVSSYLDYCVLAGDASDYIHSPDGWAEGTANKYIRQYGSIDGIKTYIEDKLATFISLCEDETSKKKDIKAFELSKAEESFLVQYDRIKLGMSLKKMDVVPNVDLPSENDFKRGDVDNFKKLCYKYGMPEYAFKSHFFFERF